MSEKAKEIICSVKGVLYANVDGVYHRITQDQLGVLETTINNQEKKINDLQDKASTIEEKYANAVIVAQRYIKFAEIVIEKNVDILYLKHARKLPLQKSLEIYNQNRNENEDKLNQFEFDFLVEIVGRLR